MCSCSGCPLYGTVHSMALSTLWHCPIYDTVHFMTLSTLLQWLSTLWHCPLYGTVHFVALSTLWHCPLSYSGCPHSQLLCGTERQQIFCSPGWTWCLRKYWIWRYDSVRSSLTSVNMNNVIRAITMTEWKFKPSGVLWYVNWKIGTDTFAGTTILLFADDYLPVGTKSYHSRWESSAT